MISLGAPANPLNRVQSFTVALRKHTCVNQRVSPLESFQNSLLGDGCIVDFFHEKSVLLDAFDTKSGCLSSDRYHQLVILDWQVSHRVTIIREALGATVDDLVFKIN